MIGLHSYLDLIEFISIHYYIILLLWPGTQGLTLHIGTWVITLHHIAFVQMAIQDNTISVRKYISVVLSHHICSSLFQQPQETNETAESFWILIP